MSSGRPVSVVTSDGWLLRGEVAADGESKRPVTVLLHAMFATRKSMDRPRGGGLGSVLASRGFGVVAFDLRGHGESGPSAKAGAQFNYDSYVLQDVPAVVAMVRELYPRRPVVIVGHSLGAHVSTVSAGVCSEKAPDAIVSIAGNMWIPSWEPSFLRRAKKTATLAGFLGLARAFGYFDPRPFRLGTESMPAAFTQQLWTMWSTDRYGSMDGRIDYRAALGRLTIPVFSVASEADTLLAHPAAVELFFAPVAESLKTMRLLRTGELDGFTPDHMGLVTHAKSRALWNELADWIACLPELP